MDLVSTSKTSKKRETFLANRIGRAFGTMCRLSVRSSVCVTFCIVAKRYVLAKNCLKEQIGLPLRLPHGTKSDPHSSPNGDYPV